jgi:multidrug transporter EmrE-like cation transporter|tara:strand:+ start:850 stop:1182 length:333 start_codon:yes stop_codon:yes gene_type:complete
MNLLFYIFIFFSTISEVFAQYLFKISHKNTNHYYLIVGIILYAFTGFFAFNLLKYTSMGIANIIWHLFHFILLFLVGYFFLDERLTKKQILATIFGIISLLLFTYEFKHH